jgi:PadR family transcriptional regulator PadR
MLGEFEYLLLTAAAGLGDNAYGAAIRAEIETTTGRTCSIGALYTTIERLEAKGLLKTWMGEATAQRGGRAKRMVRVTSKGVQAAKDFYDAVTRVSRGASWAVNRPGGRHDARQLVGGRDCCSVAGG